MVMACSKGSLTFAVVAGLMSVCSLGAQAQELLTNGDFEPVGPPPSELPGWTLEESITGSPSLTVNSANQQDFANEPGPLENEFGLWLRPWAGNTGSYTDQNRAVNAVLSQVVDDVVAGETYTFTGWSRFQPNYSGGVDFLDFLSPSGGIASPTETIFEMAFLDASESVVGAPVTVDLRDDRPAPINDAEWRQHTLSGAAPAGATSVRVSASMTEGLFNIDPEQSAYLDNFSLTGGSASGTELLSNANLNEEPVFPEEFEGWTVTEGPEDSDTLSEASFANYPGSGGTTGVWVHGFVDGGDGVLSQTVPGVAGGEYTFSAWSAFEQFYTGGFPETTTDTFMEMAFLNAAEEEIEDPLRINLLEEGQMNDQDGMGLEPEDWRQFSIDGTAPEGTAFVRVSAGAIGMVAGMESPQSAFFDDFSLMLAPSEGLAGDYNDDGVVDARDYAVWRDNLGAPAGVLPNDVDGGPIGAAQYATWRSQYGASAGSSGAAAAPEPAGVVIIGCALTLGAFSPRRRRAEPAT